LVQPAGVVVPHMHNIIPNAPEETKVEPPQEVKVEANGGADDLGTFQIGDFKN